MFRQAAPSRASLDLLHAESFIATNRQPRAKKSQLLVAMLLLSFAVHRLMYDGAPHFVHMPGSSEASRSIVYFGPLQSLSSLHIKQLEGEILPYAKDFVAVDVDPQYINGPQIVQSTYQKLLELGNKMVLIIGASLGTRLTLDLIEYNATHGHELDIRVLAIDPVRGLPDIKDKIPAVIVSLIPAEFLINSALSWLPRMLHSPPPTDKDVDQGILKQHYEVSRNFPISGFSSSLQYLIWRSTNMPASARGIPMRLLRTINDSVVGHSVDQPWLDGFKASNEHMKLLPGTLHVDFENPNRWRNAFRWALHELYPQG